MDFLADTAETPSDVDAEVARMRTQVTPENVLRVRAALLAESDRLSAAIERGRPAGAVGRCGGDPLSADAQAAFNQRIGAVVEQCQGYAATLRAAGRSLEAVARRYGHTDAEIAASYRALEPPAGNG